jgi:hypothetical protein
MGLGAKRGFSISCSPDDLSSFSVWISFLSAAAAGTDTVRRGGCWRLGGALTSAGAGEKLATIIRPSAPVSGTAAGAEDDDPTGPTTAGVTPAGVTPAGVALVVVYLSGALSSPAAAARASVLNLLTVLRWAGISGVSEASAKKDSTLMVGVEGGS